MEIGAALEPLPDKGEGRGKVYRFAVAVTICSDDLEPEVSDYMLVSLFHIFPKYRKEFRG